MFAWSARRGLPKVLLLVLLLQEKFTTRHELALLRVSALSGLVMFGAMSSLFYTQMSGVLSVSTDQPLNGCLKVQ